MVLLTGCSKVLGIEDPSSGRDSGPPLDSEPIQDDGPLSQCHPVINELTTGGTSGADEFVEIYNPCTTQVDVTDWTLVYRAATNLGAADGSVMMTLTGKMLPKALRLYAGVDFIGPSDGTWPDVTGIMQQVSGAIALRATAKDRNAIIDAVAYGIVTPGHPFIEGAPAAMMANTKSASRLPADGNDTNNNATDFMVIATPTPYARNAP
jgi:hypothetical protein